MQKSNNGVYFIYRKSLSGPHNKPKDTPQRLVNTRNNPLLFISTRNRLSLFVFAYTYTWFKATWAVGIHLHWLPALYNRTVTEEERNCTKNTNIGVFGINVWLYAVTEQSVGTTRAVHTRKSKIRVGTVPYSCADPKYFFKVGGLGGSDSYLSLPVVSEAYFW